MFIIKKIVLILIFMLGLLTLSSCGLLEGKVDEKYFENFEKINEEKEKVYNNFDEKILDDAQKTAFSIDYMIIGSADLMAAMYVSIVNLYNVTPALVSQNIEKSKDTYTITDDKDNSKVVIRYDNDTKSTQIEFFDDNDVLSYLVETTELSDGGYAYQLYSVDGDKKIVYEFYFKDGNGRLAVKDNVTSVPSSIYKKKSVSSTFATTGTRVYKIENGNYSFEGDLASEKIVIDFVIQSGLKNEYLLNETFDVTNFIIKVTYSDNTTANINVTSSMFTSSLPNTGTTGTKTFKLSYGGIEKTFTFNVVTQLKTVKDFTIKSGLNATYPVNSQFDINNILLEVTYEDDSKASVYVDNTMVVGSIPSTATKGEKQLVLKLGSIQKTFTFTVTEEAETLEEKLFNSYTNFFKTIYLDSEAFVTTYMQNFIGKGDTAKDAFMLDFNDDVISQWGSVNLAYQAVNAIYLASKADFDTLYPSPTNEWGKNNSLTFENGIFKLNLWIKIGSFNQYWFEFEIQYDDEKDTFKMHVTSGIGEQLIERAILEYVCIEEGKYAANIYFYDENHHGARHSVFQLVFTKNEGRIIKNTMVDSIPSSILNQTNFDNYAKTGDEVFEMVSSTNATYTKNLKSNAFNLYAELAYVFENNEYIFEGSLQDTIFKKVENLDDEYVFYQHSYTLDDYYLAYAIKVLKDYEEKEFKDTYDDYNATVTKSGDTTTILLSDDYADITIKVTYVQNKLVVEYEEGEYTYKVEIIKSGNEYYVQRIELSEYGYCVISKAKYVDANNAVFLYLDGEDLTPTSIYTAIPTDFLTNGQLKIELKNNTLEVKNAFIIYVYPEDGQDSYVLYTDFDGKLVLPNISNAKFLGWYLEDEEFIGKGNVTYTFTEDSTIYAHYSD